MPTGTEARVAGRTAGEDVAAPTTKLREVNGNTASPRARRCVEATKDAAARQPADKAVVEECFMTDSCGSCGQILLWCKCAATEVSLVQRTGRKTEPPKNVGQSPTCVGTPISSVWSSDDDEKYHCANSERIGEQLLKWTRTSLNPHHASMRDRTSSSASLEGRELSVM